MRLLPAPGIASPSGSSFVLEYLGVLVHLFVSMVGVWDLSAYSRIV